MAKAKKQHAVMKKRLAGRTARTWLITFIIIFIAQVSGWIAANDMVGRRLKKQTDDVYASALNVLSVSYDNCVSSVYSMLDAMTLEDAIRKRCGSALFAGQNDAYQNELVRRKLASYKLQFAFVDDIFIYFEADDKIISSNTVADASLFYDIYGDTAMPCGEWKEKLSQTYFKKDQVWENEAKANSLYILHTWPQSKQNKGNGAVTIGVKLSSAYIQNLVNNFKEDKYSAVTVRNAEDQLVVESGSPEAGNSNRSISRVSAFSGWTYTYYVSREGVKLYEDSILLLLFLCFGSMIVVFTAAIIFFYKTNFNPFMELMSYIKEQSPEKQVSGSEYVYIKDKFDEIVKKQRTDELCFINQMNQLKVSYMLQVLKGKTAVDESNRPLFEKMQLEYVYEPCGVVLLSGVAEYAGMQQENCLEAAAGYGIGMSQDSMLYGCSFLYDTCMVCVVRLDADREAMKEKLSALAGTMDDSGHGGVRVAVSSLKGEECSIKKIYEQAEFVMQSAQQLSVLGLLFYDDMQERLKENAKDSKYDYLVQQAQEYMEAHYTQPELTIEMLCGDLGRSVSYLSKIYKEKTGRNLLHDLNLVRIKAAKRLLCEEDLSIDEIGQSVGFTNSNSFIRVFKKYENVTPGKYRELHLNGFAKES